MNSAKRNLLRVFCGFLFALLLTMACAAANAAGICDFKTENASVALTVEGITPETKTIGGETYEDFCAGAEKVEVTCSDLTTGDAYVLLVLEDATVPNDANIVYIDQKTAADGTVSFTAYPKGLTEGSIYHLMLSGTNRPLEEIGSFQYLQAAGVVITEQPKDYVGEEDSVAAFTVAAEGDGLTYQWQISDNGGAKWSNSSVKTSVYTSKLTAARDGRLLRCIVKDAYGNTVISDSAAMRLYRFAITEQPMDYVGLENDSVTFTVAAEGEGLNYQWQFSDNDGAKWKDSSETSPVYTTKLISARDGRLVRCVVTDAYGTVLTSDVASMSLYAFAITSQPEDCVAALDESVTFTVEAKGEGLNYQWQFSDNDGAKWKDSSVTSPVYTTKLTSARDGRLVRCVVTDAYGSALTSESAAMRLYTLVITQQPLDCVAFDNSSVTFTVAARGQGLTYQWQLSDNGGAKWTNSSVKTDTYTAKLTAAKNGRLVRCIITDAYGASVVSDSASMKLYQLAIILQPQNCTAFENESVTFNVEAEGDGLSYQWQFSDNDGAKWTNSSVKTDTYTAKLTAAKNGRMVRCIVSDLYGNTVISDAVTMKIYRLAITSQPVDCAKHENETVRFTVEAEGDGLAYQWQYSDDDGATWKNSSVSSSTYSAKLTAAKEGRLVRCIVTDVYGNSVTSNAARMKFYQLAIIAQPQDYSGPLNSVTNIFVEVEGDGLTYQWQFSDNDGKKWKESTAKTAVYAAKLIESKDGRLVRCIITDAYGNTVTSEPAKMQIGPHILAQPQDYVGAVNSTAQFSVTVEGDGLTYQWQLSTNGGSTWSKSSVTTPGYETKLTEAKDGRLVRCVVTDENGKSVTSNAAAMHIG